MIYFTELNGIYFSALMQITVFLKKTKESIYQYNFILSLSIGSFSASRDINPAHNPIQKIKAVIQSLDHSEI